MFVDISYLFFVHPFIFYVIIPVGVPGGRSQPFTLTINKVYDKTNNVLIEDTFPVTCSLVIFHFFLVNNQKQLRRTVIITCIFHSLWYFHVHNIKKKTFDVIE